MLEYLQGSVSCCSGCCGQVDMKCELPSVYHLSAWHQCKAWEQVWMITYHMMCKQEPILPLILKGFPSIIPERNLVPEVWNKLWLHRAFYKEIKWHSRSTHQLFPPTHMYLSYIFFPSSDCNVLWVTHLWITQPWDQWCWYLSILILSLFQLLLEEAWGQHGLGS